MEPNKNKYKKYLSLLGLTLFTILTGSCAMTQHEQSSTNVTLSDTSTTNKWGQVFKKAGYVPSPTAKNESAIGLIRVLPESMQEIAGTVTNPLGIRDDILEYTLKTFKDNPKALSAAITYAQYCTIIYFTATDKATIRNYASNIPIIGWCITHYSNFQNSLDYSRGLNVLMRNNKNRKTRMNYVETNYLSPGIYGFGNLSDKELAQKCEQGNY